MSKWRKVSETSKPTEWLKVLGYSRTGGIAICQRFTHASSGEQWAVNGVSGWGVKAPTHWMPLPESPPRTAGEKHG